MKPTLFYPNGSSKTVEPVNKIIFTTRELRELLGTHTIVANTTPTPGWIVIYDKEWNTKRTIRFNRKASLMTGVAIVGPCLLCPISMY